MDFSLPPELDAKRAAVREFVQDRLIPLEADPASYDEHENISRLQSPWTGQRMCVDHWQL